MDGSTIVTINKQGIILSVDKNCCKLFGYDLDELVNHNVRTIIPSPYKEQHDTYLQNYHRTQIPRIIGKSRVVEGQHKDGTIFAIRLSVTKVGEGENIMFVGMIDKVEDKSVTVTINNKGIIISCNHNVEELFGFKSDQLIGNNISVLVAPPHREKHDEYIRHYLAGNPPKVIGKARNVIAQHKNGTVFPICLQVEHIRMGNVDLFRGKIEKVDSMEAVFTLDGTGKIVACNHNFVLPLFGYTNEQLLNQNISLLIPNIFHASSKTLGDLSSHSTLNNPTSISGTCPVMRTTSSSMKDDSDEVTSEPKPKKMKIENSSSMTEFNSNNNNTNNINTTNSTSMGNFQQESGCLSASSNGEQASNSSASARSSSWKVSGIHLRDVKHKDGSNFPINLEIHPFPDSNGNPLYSVRIRRIQMQTAESSSKSIGDYWVAKTIGQGTYGKVKLGVNKRNKTQVAIKVLSKKEMIPTEIERARREIEILQQLKHPNIASLYQILETDESINLIMEYGGRTLLSYVMEKVGLEEEEARKFFKMIASAIDYCHKRNIIHRDIKHQNILLDDSGQVKLIDFGLSNFIEEGKLRSTFCGTPAYAAPEMILGKKYTGPEVDVWSLGVVLYSMITGGFPFENVCDILSGQFEDPKKVSKECCDIIRGMLTVDAQKRFSLGDVMQTTWFTSEVIVPKVIECQVIDTHTSSNKETTNETNNSALSMDLNTSKSDSKQEHLNQK